jgi:hypothetical protein
LARNRRGRFYTKEMKERKNILFGDLIVKDGNKKKELKNCVWTEGDTIYKKKDIIKILSFKIVGQTSVTKDYTEAKKNEEIRNNITGAYE